LVIGVGVGMRGHGYDRIRVQLVVLADERFGLQANRARVIARRRFHLPRLQPALAALREVRGGAVAIARCVEMRGDPRGLLR